MENAIWLPNDFCTSFREVFIYEKKEENGRFRTLPTNTTFRSRRVIRISTKKRAKFRLRIKVEGVGFDWNTMYKYLKYFSNTFVSSYDLCLCFTFNLLLNNQRILRFQFYIYWKEYLPYSIYFVSILNLYHLLYPVEIVLHWQRLLLNFKFIST